MAAKANLKKYHDKRRFQQTPEPKGGTAAATEPFFVVQRHHARRLHDDFRFALDGVLKSWAIPKTMEQVGSKLLAVQTEDHPLEYADFEGTIPKGQYGAGEVHIFDRGRIIPESQEGEAPEAALRRGLKKGHLSFQLAGTKLQGQYSLVKMKKGDGDNWLLIPKDAKAKALPPIILPMLASEGGDPFDDEDYLFEIKWDGYRAIATVFGGEVRLTSRRGQNLTRNFPQVVRDLSRIKGDNVFDGELVVLDEKGIADFQRLQNSLRRGDIEDVHYMIFDLLYYEDKSIMDKPLRERKELLRKLLEKSGKFLHYQDHVLGRGKEFYELATKQGLEGVVAKHAEAPYLPGKRSDAWLKIKSVDAYDVAVVGYVSVGKRLKSLLLATNRDGDLVYCGRVGSGLKRIPDLAERLKKLHTASAPLKNPPSTKELTRSPKGQRETITWVKPELIITVHGQGWTRDGSIRQPRVWSERTDKKVNDLAAEVEEVAFAGQRRPVITNPDKIMYPALGANKNDLVGYYESVADFFVSFSQGRPMALLRYPNSVEGKGFFQKNIDEAVPDYLRTILIPSRSTGEGKINYPIVSNRDALLFLANWGTIEFHPWPSRLPEWGEPDYVVLDLDPEEVPWEKVVGLAQRIKGYFDEWEIPLFPKTSGKRGLHLYIPIKPSLDFKDIGTFAELLAQAVHEREREITTLARKPKRRPGKVFLDYFRNLRAQTTVAPYSLRANATATASTPLQWREVTKRLDPSAFNLNTMRRRLDSKGDVWEEFESKRLDVIAYLQTAQFQAGA